MQKTKALLLVVFITTQLTAQDKPVIDTGLLDKWPSLSPYAVALSRDGHYVAYTVYNQPETRATLMIQDLRGKWKKAIVSDNPQILFFTADSRHLCWRKGDSIWLQKTGEDKAELLSTSGRISYPINTKGKWLALPAQDSAGPLTVFNLTTGAQLSFDSVENYDWTGDKLLLKSSAGKLICLDLATERKTFFHSVKSYLISPDGKMVLVAVQGSRSEGVKLLFGSLTDAAMLTIWQGRDGEEPADFIFDKTGRQLSFSVRKSDRPSSIWYYRRGQPSSILKVNNTSTGVPKHMQVVAPLSFSDNGRWLFFNLRKPVTHLAVEPESVLVDIWTYRDRKIFPDQPSAKNDFEEYTAVAGVENNQILQLQYEGVKLGGSAGDYVELFTTSQRPEDTTIHWLHSLKDGSTTLLKRNTKPYLRISGCSSSPEGKWLYYWDPECSHYFFIDAQTGRKTNVTAGLPSFVNDVEQGVVPLPEGVMGWYRDDKAVLIYDNFDIWKIDPAGKDRPINLTGGYGRRQHIKLRAVYDNHVGVYGGAEELLLAGYNTISKYNGFFRLRLNKPGEPELLTMGPYTYYQDIILKQSFGPVMRPLVGGSEKKKRWIVMRESATEYPNFFVSEDLRQFKPLTNLQPQKAYNWLSTEVFNWRMPNGQFNSGVLYKPENFDPTKKYPVIFNYYEKYSQRCYQFPTPGLTTDNINIPWFVSRGYLVFTPDVQFTTAADTNGFVCGQAALDAVVSSAELLSRLPYVDKTRMGIQGHSFGGGETNFIVANTDLFAAACTVAPTVSDQVSAYLGMVRPLGGPVIQYRLGRSENGHDGIGATLWQRPDLYIKSSPVFNADKVVTPLLIMHNYRDIIDWEQSAEFYTALRRLNKPCWMLQYDGESHVLMNRKNALDFTIRLTQYFDHYLKGAPAPQWMTMQSLAAYKGKNNLYQLDPAGDCMKGCRICKEWNEKKSEK